MMQSILRVHVVVISICVILIAWPCSSQCLSSTIVHTMRVSQSGGRGVFSRVQDAIDAVPSDNTQWINIVVSPGTYIEQVQIPPHKQCVLLEGNSPLDTTITFNAHGATDASATFTFSADNVVAKNIAFVNSYGREEGEVIKPALATRVYGDKSAFYNCHFVGIQDTLWDVQGRHYFKSCYIEGAVDFIWGTGQSVFEDCEVNVTTQVLGPSISAGYVTAQGREASTDPSGFVFIRGAVYGSGQAYLGRAYGAYSRVIFRETKLGIVVVPLGWDAWSHVHYEGRLSYTEANCKGAGADLSHRVAWMKMQSAQELSRYTVPAFIDQDGWISKQPTTTNYNQPFWLHYY